MDPSIFVLIGTGLTAFSNKFSLLSIFFILGKSGSIFLSVKIWPIANSSVIFIFCSLDNISIKKFLSKSTNKPQPSPVLPSAPMAPLCVMLLRASIDFVMIL